MEHFAFRKEVGSPPGDTGVPSRKPAIGPRHVMCALLGGGLGLLWLASFGLAPCVLDDSWSVPPNRFVLPVPTHVLLALDVTSLFRALWWLLALVLLASVGVTRLPATRRLRPALLTASLLLFLSGIGLVYYLLTLPLWVETHYGLAVRLALFEPSALR